MVREMACRKCKSVTIGKVCPLCKSSDLTPDWSCVALIVDPKNVSVEKNLWSKTIFGWEKNVGHKNLLAKNKCWLKKMFG